MDIKNLAILLPLSTILISGCGTNEADLDEKIISMSKSQIELTSDNSNIKNLNSNLKVPFLEISLGCSNESLSKFDNSFKVELIEVMNKVINNEELSPKDKEISKTWTDNIQPCISEGIQKNMK